MNKRRKNPWKRSENKKTSDCNIEMDLGLSTQSTPKDKPILGPSLPTVSSSKSKLDKHLDVYKRFEKSDFQYEIVDLKTLMQSIFSLAQCKVCRSELEYDVPKRVGLAAKIVVRCSKCDSSGAVVSSPKLEYNEKTHNLYDINLRLVYAMRSIGRGQSSANMFCAVLNLPKPTAKFSRYMEYIIPAVKLVANQSMLDAIEETVEKNDGKRDICIGLDGSWQKRGHVSLNGVITATSVETGHVIDLEVLSKHCLCPKKATKVHKADCRANYIGTSGGMEVQGARRIFGRSVQKYNARYLKYLGDGDSKGFQTVSKEKFYGDAKITKLECIGHVQKRMYNRLLTLKTKLGKKKLGDGKTISGRGRLTLVAMKTLQLYYGNAIRRHTNGTLKAMKQEVWASYFHVSSSNEKPLHSFCPKGRTSWCKYQRAKASKKSYDHKKHFHLPKDIMLAIKKVYRDLAHPDLLKKCLHGKSQNPNESFNNVLWTRVPKNVFVSLETLKFGAYDAVATFNKGNIARCLVLEKLGLPVGKVCAGVLKTMDELRIKKAEKEITDLQKKARQSATSSKRKLEELYREEEDPNNPSYAAGHY